MVKKTKIIAKDILYLFEQERISEYSTLLVIPTRRILSRTSNTVAAVTDESRVSVPDLELLTRKALQKN